jgi:hypothetical protein
VLDLADGRYADVSRGRASSPLGPDTGGYAPRRFARRSRHTLVQSGTQLTAPRPAQALPAHPRRFRAAFPGCARGIRPPHPHSLAERQHPVARGRARAAGQPVRRDHPAVVNDITGELAVTRAADGPHLRIDVPARCVVRGDPVLLSQMVRNLVDNALRYNAIPTWPLTPRRLPCQSYRGTCCLGRSWPTLARHAQVQRESTLIAEPRRVWLGGNRSAVTGVRGSGPAGRVRWRRGNTVDVISIWRGSRVSVTRRPQAHSVAFASATTTEDNE